MAVSLMLHQLRLITGLTSIRLYPSVTYRFAYDSASVALCPFQVLIATFQLHAKAPRVLFPFARAAEAGCSIWTC